MSEWRYATRLQVRFRDCDPLGHVNNAVYSTYFEVARVGYWNTLFGDLRTRGPGFIVARMEVDFRAPAEPGDELEIRMRTDAIGRSSFVLVGQIVRPTDGTLIADSRGVMVTYDYRRGVSIPVPDDTRQRIEAFEGREFARPV